MRNQTSVLLEAHVKPDDVSLNVFILSYLSEAGFVQPLFNLWPKLNIFQLKQDKINYFVLRDEAQEFQLFCVFAAGGDEIDACGFNAAVA